MKHTIKANKGVAVATGIVSYTVERVQIATDHHINNRRHDTTVMTISEQLKLSIRTQLLLSAVHTVLSRLNR